MALDCFSNENEVRYRISSVLVFALPAPLHWLCPHLRARVCLRGGNLRRRIMQRKQYGHALARHLRQRALRCQVQQHLQTARGCVVRCGTGLSAAYFAPHL